MDAFLIVQRGEDIGRRFDLKNTQLTIGRGSDNDLVLNDPMVSRYHAVLKRQDNRYTLIDLGSSNPVVINDQALEPGTPHQITHRDVVFIGRTVFSFQHRTAGAVTGTNTQTAVADKTLVSEPPLAQHNTPSQHNESDHTMIASEPLHEQESLVSEQPVASGQPENQGGDDNERTLIGGDRGTSPRPAFSAPHPPPTAVKFDEEETNAGVRIPPPPPPFTGGNQPTPGKANQAEDDGDLPTQIIPRH